MLLCCQLTKGPPANKSYFGYRAGETGPSKRPGILGHSTWKELGDSVAKGNASMVYCPENKGTKCHAWDCSVTKLGLPVKVITYKSILLLQPAV